MSLAMAGVGTKRFRVYNLSPEVPNEAFQET